MKQQIDVCESPVFRFPCIEKPQFSFCTTLLNWPGLRSRVFGSVSKAFIGEEHLLPVSELELIGSFVQGLSMVVLCNDTPVAHTRLLQLTDYESPAGEWYELGSTWVHPEYAGQNLCTQMYEQFLPSHDSKNILATTTNKAALSVGRKLGFCLVRRKSLPDCVWEASCSCSSSKTGVLKNTGCLRAHDEPQHDRCNPHGTCWFRVTQPTAKRLGIA